MYEVLKRGRIHSLSVECQLQLFDKIVKPMLNVSIGWTFGDLAKVLIV
jgi:hypothetical protein